MTTRTRILSTFALAVLALTVAPAMAQRDLYDYERRGGYGNWNDTCFDDHNSNDRYRPTSSRDRWHRTDDFGFAEDRDRYRDELSWNRDRYRPASYRPSTDRLDRWHQDADDLFRSPRRSNDRPVRERRYRIPLRDYGFSQDRFDDGFDYDYDDGYGRTDDFGSSRDRYDLDRRTQPDPGYDPLTPPLPRRDGGSEAEALSKRITARYQNPTTVRMIRSMSTDQAVRLFREVSAQTDARHLEPSSYDLRVRRALRNLSLALENPTATRALGISQDSFQVDGFRDTMARLWDSLTVRSQSDAEQVMQTVMQSAQRVQGMSPGLVAYEFSNATVDTLDKFSALEPAEPGRGPSAALESEMVGIGVEVKEDDAGLLVMRALKGSPSAEAGLKSGDVIIAINQRRISGMPMAQSVDLIKGPSGSRIQLQIDRSGRRQSVTLTRRRFRVWSVNDVRMVSGTDVGYLNLSQFAQSSTQEVDQALSQLHRNGMKSLIVDLRGNPGGLLTTCVQITNRFLPCGTIVSTKGRLSSDNMHESATFSRTWDIPLVVLIDGDSASASEIFAAAIQDNERGVVVGEQSYGKGTVQTHFPLQSINGNLRLTTARFYAPSGRAMSGSGVTPDVRIEDRDGVANGDRVMDEAVHIARSRQLKEMAVNSGKCRTNNGAPYRNSFNRDMFDAVKPLTVLR